MQKVFWTQGAKVSQESFAPQKPCFAPVQLSFAPVQEAFGALGPKDLLHPLLTTLGTFEVSGPCSRTFGSQVQFGNPQAIDEGQITHLICARLKYDLYDFFRGCFGPFLQGKEQEAGPKHPLKKSYRSYFRRAQIR